MDTDMSTSPQTRANPKLGKRDNETRRLKGLEGQPRLMVFHRPTETPSAYF